MTIFGVVSKKKETGDDIMLKKKGFTLVEIIIAMAILAVLMVILTPSLITHIEDSRAQKDDSAMSEIVSVIKQTLDSDTDIYDDIYRLGKVVEEEDIYISMHEDTEDGGLTPHVMGKQLHEVLPELDVKLRDILEYSYKTTSKAYHGMTYNIYLHIDEDSEVREVYGVWEDEPKENNAVTIPELSDDDNSPTFERPEQPETDIDYSEETESDNPGSGGEETGPQYSRPKAKSLIYNGALQELIIAGSTTDGTMYYRLEGENWQTSLPTATDAGQYVVQFYIKGSNYSDSAISSIKPIIQKANPVVTPPVAEELFYNGTQQLLATPGSVTGGTLQYSLDKDTWGTTMPTGTNAGTYTLWYRVVGDNNYNNVAPKSISVSIQKERPTVTVIGNSGLEYNGTSQNLLSTHNSTGGTLHYRVGLSGTWSTTPPKATDAGNYTIYYYAGETGNYEGYMSESSPGSTTASIAKKTVPSAKAPLVAGDDWSYDGSTHTVTPSGAGWSFTYSEDNANFSSDLPTRTNAGKTTVYWKASHKNYLDCNGISYLICNKAAPKYTQPTGKELQYSGKPQVLITAGSAENVTMYYRLSTSNTWSSELPTATLPGIYTVNFYIAETENYRGTSESGVVSTIYPEKAPDSEMPVIDGKTWEYDGNAYGVTASNADGWTIKYSKNKNTGYSSASPTLTDVGDLTVYWEATHTIYSSVSGSAVLKCTPAKMTIEVTNGETTYSGNATNGGASLNVSGTTKPFIPTITFGESESDCSLATIPEYTNAGTYTVYYKVEAANYETETGSLTILINKAVSHLSIQWNNTSSLAYGQSLTGVITRNDSGAQTNGHASAPGVYVSCSSSTISIVNNQLRQTEYRSASNSSLRGQTIQTASGYRYNSVSIFIYTPATENYLSASTSISVSMAYPYVVMTTYY